MKPVPLSSDWIKHNPNDSNKCIKKRGVLRAGADCPCGITERHEHCLNCGRVIAIGDWDAEPIAEYTWNLSTGEFKKTK